MALSATAPITVSGGASLPIQVQPAEPLIAASTLAQMAIAPANPLKRTADGAQISEQGAPAAIKPRIVSVVNGLIAVSVKDAPPPLAERAQLVPASASVGSFQMGPLSSVPLTIQMPPIIQATPDIFCRRAQYYVTLNNFSTAISMWFSALQLTPPTNGILRKSIILDIALACRKHQQPNGLQSSIDFLNQAKDIQTEDSSLNAEVLFHLSTDLLNKDHMGERDNAIQYFKQIAAMHLPNLPGMQGNTLYALSALLWERNAPATNAEPCDRDIAIASLKKGLELQISNDTKAVFRLTLGKYLKERNRAATQDALSDFDAAFIEFYQASTINMSPSFANIRSDVIYELSRMYAERNKPGNGPVPPDCDSAIMLAYEGLRVSITNFAMVAKFHRVLADAYDKKAAAAPR